jgi:hypothetical protein
MTLPYYIDFTLRRPAGGNDKPFIFRWGPYRNAFVHAQLVLLHITEHGPERVEVEPLEFASADENTILVNGWNQFLWNLPPGGETKMRDSLTANYQRRLKPGEKYALLWPGAEIGMWDWGSMSDHVGKELESQDTRKSKLLQLVLPASRAVLFTAKQESDPWPDRPETMTEAEFPSVNLKEADWRREEDHQRNLPRSPPPMMPSERV